MIVYTRCFEAVRKYTSNIEADNLHKGKLPAALATNFFLPIRFNGSPYELKTNGACGTYERPPDSIALGHREPQRNFKASQLDGKIKFSFKEDFS